MKSLPAAAASGLPNTGAAIKPCCFSRCASASCADKATLHGAAGDVYGAGLEMLQNAGRAQRHFTQRGIIGQHGENHIGITNFRNIFRGLGPRRNQRLQTFYRSVVDGKFVSCLTQSGRPCLRPFFLVR